MSRPIPRGPERSARAWGHPADIHSFLVSENSQPGAEGARVPLTPGQRDAVTALVARFPVTDELGRRFAGAGHELHLVGGSVRDALLDRLGTDLDFTTDARPEQIQVLLDGWADATWTTGIEFGTVGATRGGVQLE